MNPNKVKIGNNKIVTILIMLKDYAAMDLIKNHFSFSLNTFSRKRIKQFISHIQFRIHTLNCKHLSQRWFLNIRITLIPPNFVKV